MMWGQQEASRESVPRPDMVARIVGSGPSTATSQSRHPCPPAECELPLAPYCAPHQPTGTSTLQPLWQWQWSRSWSWFNIKDGLSFSLSYWLVLAFDFRAALAVYECQNMRRSYIYIYAE